MSVVFMLFVKLSVFFVHCSFACSLFLTGFQESKYLGGAPFWQTIHFSSIFFLPFVLFVRIFNGTFTFSVFLDLSVS